MAVGNLRKEYTELSMSNEQTPQHDEDLEVANQTEQQDAEQEVVELTEDEQRIVELEAALIAAETKLADQKDSVMRAIADADNARKRAQGEIDKARKFALEKNGRLLRPAMVMVTRAPEDGVDTQA